MWSHGSFHWNELMARDVEQAKTFYSATVGWTFDAMPMPDGTYWVAKIGDKPAGYVLSHPWLYGTLPPLNTLLERLPAEPDTYYLHDLCLLPVSRRVAQKGGNGRPALHSQLQAEYHAC